MGALRNDLKYGLRMLLKSPGFTAVALLALALGIGANTAIFSVVNGLLLRPLPYKDSDRLAIIWTHSPGANVMQDWPSPGQFSAIKSQTDVFEDIAIAQGSDLIVTGRETPERVGAVWGSSNLFPLLGVRPALGRTFTPEEDAPGRQQTVVLSYGFWQSHFGGNNNVLGQTLMLNNKPYTVVGVMPADFSLGYEVMPTVGAIPQPDLLLPLPLGADDLASQGDENYNLIARLKPGVTVARAQSELDVVAQRLAQSFPKNYPQSRRFSFSVRPLLEQVVGDIRPALLVLLCAVGCVLLIACANVANLLLARASIREKEIAIRTAVGATRWRVVRQLLTESVLLASVGGAIGLLLAVWGLEALRALNPSDIPRLQNISIDLRVLAFTSAVAFLTGVLFGVAPALRAAQVNLTETLKEGGRSLAGSGQSRLRGALVVAEIALSLVLLVGAGLLVRSFMRVLRVEPGFDARDVVSMRLAVPRPPGANDDDAAAHRRLFYEQLLERVRRVHGVESDGAVSVLPLGGGISWGGITIEGQEPPGGASSIQADMRATTPGYFETMRIPLINGRYFDEHDTKDSQRVVVVDENMARTYWRGSDAVGKRLKTGGADSKNPWMTVVGVVASVKQYALDTDSRVALYVPHAQMGMAPSTMYLVARTPDAAGVAAAVRKEAQSLDPNVPVYDVKTMGQLLSESLARRRFAMFALSLFALAALILAAVGIYGVMAYTVTRRTHEIGVRMALGAQRGDVLRLVVGHGMALAAAGLAIGLVGALACARLLGSLLYDVSASDPQVLGLITLLLALVSLAACVVPARRASRVDPLIALRYE